MSTRIPLIETIPEGTFGRYLLELMQKKDMTIKQFRSQVDTDHPRITQERFYSLVRGEKKHGKHANNGKPADRSMDWIDLIVFAQVLDSDPVEMIAMYMANKDHYESLSKEQVAQVAFNTFLLTVLNLLPACERNDLMDIAQMKAKRHRIDLDKERDRLHHSRYASQYRQKPEAG